MGTFFGAFSFAFLILFAIFFHELGHFLTARWAGIKVTKFFVGFGPTVWSRRRGPIEVVSGPDGERIERPETEYGIKALPLGGYVKVLGMSPFEDIPPEDEPRSFAAAPTWKRAIVLAAGSVTHIITAFVILFVIFSALGVAGPTLSVGEVADEVAGERTPAAAAGLRAGDRITAIDGRRAESWDDVRGYIRDHPGESVELRVERGGRPVTLTTRLAEQRAGNETIGFLGVLPELAIQRVGPITGATRSVETIGRLVQAFTRTAPQAFSPRTLGLTGGDGPAAERPFSILGAGRIAADLVSHGRIVDFLALFVQINVFIGIFNMLPLPPLDGGHLLLLGIEKLRRGRAVDPKRVLPVVAVVLSLLLALMVLLVFYDIVSPVRIPTQ